MENENQTDLEEVIQEVENETPQEIAEEPAVEESKPEIDLDKFESKDDPEIVKTNMKDDRVFF